MTQNRKQKIEQAFGEKVASYNRHAVLQRKSAKKLCCFLPETAPTKILEIGCGTGFLTEELQKRYPHAEIIGIDISKEMVFSCRQKFTGYQNLSFDVADGENFKSNQKFDFIVSNLAVQWFDNPIIGLRNLSCHLNKGGELYFSTIGKNSFQEWKKTLASLNYSSGIIDSPDYEGIFEEENEIIPYKNALDFLQNFKKIGAHQPKENYKPLSRQELLKACKAFDTAHQGNITWHLLYGRLKRPV